MLIVMISACLRRDRVSWCFGAIVRVRSGGGLCRMTRNHVRLAVSVDHMHWSGALQFAMHATLCSRMLVLPRADPGPALAVRQGMVPIPHAKVCLCGPCCGLAMPLASSVSNFHAHHQTMQAL